MDRIVLHLDMDAFFASVEEQDRPRLKGLPIVVGADPAGGRGRGVVSTANYKAREYGIHSAQPISTAWRLSEDAMRRGLPAAIFLEPNFKRYSEVSHGIMEYLVPHAAVVEQASVDEAYLEVKSDWEKAEEIAKEIKAHIKKKYGLTCSIGIGPNKLIAKIAAGTQKPDGLTVVRAEAAEDFLAPMKASVIPGIGPKSTIALGKLGIKTIHDLRTLSRERLHELFGKWGLGMFDRARGIDDSPVVAEYEAKSIGEQETFQEDSLDATFVIARMQALAKSVWGSVKKERAKFRGMSITVRFSDFETKTRAHTFTGVTDELRPLESMALQLLMPFLDSRENPRKKKIRLIGVRVEKFE